MKYAILSDIHGNLEAFTTVLQKCKELEVDQYICLGDIVGYNANPKECLDIIRTLPLAGVVKGNHDEYASNNDEVMEGFNPHARTAVLWTKAQLTYEDRAWLSSLPMRLTVKGTSITAVHATLDSPMRGAIFSTFTMRRTILPISSRRSVSAVIPTSRSDSARNPSHFTPSGR